MSSRRWCAGILVLLLMAQDVVPDVNENNIFLALGAQLSFGASISDDGPLPRWSNYEAPSPGSIVTVKSEEDVVSTVQYCISNNISFLVQNGGNGWSTTFDCHRNGVLIDLQALNTIEFSANKATVTIGGGVLVRDLVSSAYQNDAQVLTGNCNCISVLGANLGGGYSRLMGEYGFGVDNILSMNVVTAEGKLITVDRSNKELWFAMRGAGPNFGIATSATLKSYPLPREKSGAWMGPLVFAEEKLAQVIKAINDLDKRSRMSIFLYFAAKPPDFKPQIIVIPFYLNAGGKAAESAFASILNLGPVINLATWTPYDQVNSASEDFCVKGGQKPTYGAGLGKLDVETWVTVWERYKAYIKTPGAGTSTILVEGYPLQQPVLYGDDTSSYPFRSIIKYNVAVTAVYTDDKHASKARAFGRGVRELLWSTGGLSADAAYINYAHGDEPLETVYGSNLGKLQDLKRKHDPENRFNQWFPLLR